MDLIPSFKFFFKHIFYIWRIWRQFQLNVPVHSCICFLLSFLHWNSCVFCNVCGYVCYCFLMMKNTEKLLSMVVTGSKWLLYHVVNIINSLHTYMYFIIFIANAFYTINACWKKIKQCTLYLIQNSICVLFLNTIIFILWSELFHGVTLLIQTYR